LQFRYDGCRRTCPKRAWLERAFRGAVADFRPGERMSHFAQVIVEVTILALAIFLGIEVISKVPTLLHTPLMSGTNAIHGIVIVGAILVAGMASPDLLTGWVGFIAMILASANVVGGFVVTDRMLEMFKKREPRRTEEEHPE
jgi:NAD(P) transhydrogenase subunit alpha